MLPDLPDDTIDKSTASTSEPTPSTSELPLELVTPLRSKRKRKPVNTESALRSKKLNQQPMSNQHLLLEDAIEDVDQCDDEVDVVRGLSICTPTIRSAVGYGCDASWTPQKSEQNPTR